LLLGLEVAVHLQQPVKIAFNILELLLEFFDCLQVFLLVLLHLLIFDP